MDRSWNSEGIRLSLIEDVNRSLKLSGAYFFEIVEILSLGSLFCLHNLHTFRSDWNHGLSYMLAFSYFSRNIIVSQRLALFFNIFQWIIEFRLILIGWKWNVGGYLVIWVAMGRRRNILLGRLRILLGLRRRYISRSAYQWVGKSKSSVGMLRFSRCHNRNGLRFLTRWWRARSWRRWGWRRDSIL